MSKYAQYCAASFLNRQLGVGETKIPQCLSTVSFVCAQQQVAAEVNALKERRDKLKESKEDLECRSQADQVSACLLSGKM